MIELQVENKCQNCPHFSPEINRIDVTSFGDKGRRYIQTVYCGEKDFCDNLEEYLEIQ